MLDPNDIETADIYFENLIVGQRFRSQGRTLTETDIVNFAGLSGDFNALHTDESYAATTQHGTRIAHGLLVLAIASGLSSRMAVMRGLERTLVGLANLECRWLKPARIGDTLHVAAEILELVPSSRPDRGTVLMRRSAMNQHDVVVMESDWKLVLKRRIPALEQKDEPTD
jgi:acyl dehydratase